MGTIFFKWAVAHFFFILESPFFKIWHCFSCAYFLPFFLGGGAPFLCPLLPILLKKKIENNFWSIYFGRTEILVFEFIWYCKLCVKDGLSKDKGGLSKNQSGMAVGTPLL